MMTHPVEWIQIYYLYLKIIAVQCMRTDWKLCSNDLWGCSVEFFFTISVARIYWPGGLNRSSVTHLGFGHESALPHSRNISAPSRISFCEFFFYFLLHGPFLPRHLAMPITAKMHLDAILYRTAQCRYWTAQLRRACFQCIRQIRPQGLRYNCSLFHDSEAWFHAFHSNLAGLFTTVFSMVCQICKVFIFTLQPL